MAPDDSPVVVDTNIIFSALLSAESRFRAILFASSRQFLICETTVIELFRLKEKLRALRPQTTEDTLLSMLHAILRRVDLVREDSIAPEVWAAARSLCDDVDPDDTPHVAVAMASGALLWTGDSTLKRGLLAKGYTGFFVPSEETR
ncbi:MAG TPA: PIN domain-containing protein [Longimicrobiaceae bacterium]|nr:PIN domain-containing protein [Longimicrobiaceae bacterium]